MGEILRDSIWQFVGIILAVIAIAISLIVYFLQRSKKSLSYELVYDTQLFTDTEELKEDFKIYYKDRPITQAGIIVLRIVNDGNQPITTTDFEKQLSVIFEKEIQIFLLRLSGLIQAT